MADLFPNSGGDVRRGYCWPMFLAPLSLLFFALAGCGEEVTPIPVPVETSEAVSFTTQDGVELKGRLFGRSATGVVLSHMFPSDQRSWWSFAQLLSDNGFMTLTFNFRGYGEADERSEDGKDIELIDRDVEAALEFLEKQGASTVFLVGASMGGTASLIVAERREVAGVVSLSSPVDFHGLKLKEVRVRIPALLLVTRGDVAAKNNLKTMTDEGIVGPRSEGVVYEEGNDHGTDILTGKNGDDARKRILAFLEASTR